MPFPTPQPYRRILRASRMMLGKTQFELGNMFRLSSRTILRWERGRSYPSDDQARQLAALVREYDDDLADLVLRGSDLPVPPRVDDAAAAPAASASVPQVGAEIAARYAVDAIVCAAAASMDASPRVVRPALAVAFARAAETGMSLDALVGLLRAAEG